MQRRLFACVGVLVCAFQLSACGSGDSSAGGRRQAQDETVDRNGVPLVWARDWGGLTMIANSAKTSMDVTGHYSTSRNACGFEAYGKFEFEFWNDIATKLNEVAQGGFVADDKAYCVAWPEHPGMDGTVELELTGGPTPGKRELYFQRNGEICSVIADHRLSDSLLSLLNEFVRFADKKDCPNGWGG